MKKLGRPSTVATKRVRELMQELGISYSAAYQRFRREQEDAGVRSRPGYTDPPVLAYLIRWREFGMSEHEARLLVHSDKIREHYVNLEQEAVLKNSEPESRASVLEGNPLRVQVLEAKHALRMARMSGDRASIDEAAKLYRAAREAAGLPWPPPQDEQL